MKLYFVCQQFFRILFFCAALIQSSKLSGTIIAGMNVISGIDVIEFDNIAQAVKAQPELDKFQFRATNSWDMGGLSRTTIRGFYGAGEEYGKEDRTFGLEAHERPVLLGEDRTANPAE